MTDQVAKRHKATTSTTTNPTSALDAAVLGFLQGVDEGDVCAKLDALITTHSAAAVEGWRQGGKHSHALVHELVRRRKGEVLKHLVDHHAFDLNVARASDACTPLHLSAWTKQPALMKLLLDLGADATLSNKYGEDCSQVVATAAKMDACIWLDLELTHLPKDKLDCADAILECAVVITNKDLVVVEKKAWVVHHAQATLAQLSEWHQTNFGSAHDGGNGLFADVLASDTTKDQMEAELMQLLDKHCVEGVNRLAGNSVHCDREVLMMAMPKVYKFVSHQVLDVSTVINLTQMWNPTLASQQPPMLSYNHRAVNDIEASIVTMRWLREHALVGPVPV